MIEQTECNKCKKDLNENFNFCPYCGEPISDVAKQIVSEKSTIEKIKMIDNLSQVIKDKESLKVFKRVVEELEK